MPSHAIQQPGTTSSTSRLWRVVQLILILWLALSGPSEAKGASLSEAASKEPIPVKIGIKLQQITNVDQKAENFSVVATLMLRWHDPALAYNPDSDPCRCRIKVFKESSFDQFLRDKGRQRPEFTIYNQQGNRSSQNSLGGVIPNGDALHFERFSATLQAPEFNFRRFPFDQQEFFIHIDSIYPEDYYVFTDLEGFSEVGTKLGVEEWEVQSFDTFVSSVTASTRQVTSRFSFRVMAKRHQMYYVFRIFLPMLIILTIAWVTFFIRDYGNRINLANGILLVFVAFNFTISNDLPRLGYMTFLDTVMVCAFIMTSLTVIMNVYLRRFETSGREATAHRLDRLLIWGYPLSWLAAVVVLIALFHIW